VSGGDAPPHGFTGEPPLPPDVPGRLSCPPQKLTDDFRRFRLLGAAEYVWRHRAPVRGTGTSRPRRRRTGAPPSIYRLVVPVGFEHDFASVPRPLWALVAPIDLGLASIFHDWLYREGGRVATEEWTGPTPADPEGAWIRLDTPWRRDQADALFARIMREQGVVKWRRRVAYASVQTFGEAHWRSPTS